MADDSAFMRRALDLAERGRTTVSPNPLVGCVLVRDNEVIAEGWHDHAGGPHAEIVALRAAGGRAAGATAYVTLEPCAHTGRTGPCADALIAAGITRVVVATPDPNPVAAGGAAALRAAGITVDTGVLQAAARAQNEVFFSGIATTRPFVIAKVAASLDGRIAAADGTSQWLTGPETRARVHRLRAEVDAVVVGSGTVLADDPQLTVRLDDYRGAQPLRVVLDRRGRVQPFHRVTDAAAPSLLARQSTLEQVLDELWNRGVRSVLVEGGASVLAAFLAAGLVDRLEVHLAPVLLGERGRPLVAGPWATTLDAAPRFVLGEVERSADDVVLTYVPSPATDPAPASAGSPAEARV